MLTGAKPTNGKMARAASMKQASSSPTKEGIRTKRVTRLVSKKKTSINNSSTAKNTSGTTLKRPVKRLTNASKKQSDKIVKAKGKNTSNTASTIPVKKSTRTSKISDKEVKVKSNKSPKIKKQPAETTAKVQNEGDEKLPSNIRKSRITKPTAQSKDESTKKTKISATTSKRISKQISLKESFLNQTNSKRLRPRKVVRKNCCEGTISTSKSGLEPNLEQKEKVPIYKSIPVDEPDDNADEIYDFKFDKNDSTERIKRKKKRPPKLTVVQKLMKARAQLKLKNNTAKTAIPSKEGDRDQENVKEEPEVPEIPEIPEPLAESEEPTAAVVIQASILKVVNAQDEEDANKENLHTSPPQNSDIVKQTAFKLKPSVTAVENLKNKQVVLVGNTSSPLNRDDFKPFRPTNVFNSKLSVPNKSMLNHSLLEKSLSPIVNTLKTFDDGSPWRAPPLYTFSQVKNLYQSTPQRNNIDASVNKFQRGTTDLTNFVKSITPTQKQNNALNIEKTIFINNQRKKPLPVTRRFGTEITNIDQSMPVHDQSADVGRIVVPAEIPVLEPDSVNINHNVEDMPVLKETNDTKHNILSFQTPKKAGKIKFRKVKSRSPLKRIQSKENKLDKENAGPIPGPSGLQRIRSPIKEHAEKRNSGKENIESTPEVSVEHIKSPAEQCEDSLDKENLEPTAGPSGLQKSGSPGEQRILRQSNLNNYLNLMDMPESTKITTPHGIFGDINSPVKSSKPLKKLNESKVEINNAFGFIEDTTDENISPAEQSINDRDEKQPIVKKYFTKDAVPARLSIREIKNHLIIKHNEGDTENKKDPATKTNKSPLKQKPHVIQDIANFSDTFDVVSETCESIGDTSSVPLFADLEPSYFTKPPKHSYKRKRGVHFSFSDNSESEDDEVVHKAKPKRRKAGKMSKVEEKRLKAWVQDVNKTFEEIDHYDLVVE